MLSGFFRVVLRDLARAKIPHGHATQPDSFVYTSHLYPAFCKNLHSKQGQLQVRRTKRSRSNESLQASCNVISDQLQLFKSIIIEALYLQHWTTLF